MNAYHVRIYHGPVQSDGHFGQFPISFEVAFAALENIDRLFIELDGSFVWRREAFQIDGHLYDRLDRLYYVELSGSAPVHALQEVIASCQSKDEDLVVELVRSGQHVAYKEWLDSLGESNASR